MKSTEKKALRSNLENIQNDAADILLAENEKLKLIQELQVHQIELESQNVELQRLKQEADLISYKYTELYDFAPSAYFTVSEQGSIEELNLTGAKMLGQDRALLTGKILSYFVTKATKANFELFLQRLFKSHSTEYCEVSITSHLHKHYDLYLSGIAKAGEEHCFITAVDISERKILENDLTLAKDRAEESDRLKTAFLHNMSHEIRSPLNAIKGFSQILVKYHGNKEKLDKYTRIIDQRSDDLLGIINDLLDIAKIESGQLTVNMEKCHIKSLMDDLSLQFKEVQTRLNKQHISFEMITTDLPEDTTFISDGTKLRQIFINLLTNAFKFTSQGKITGNCRQEGDYLVFFVTDTGIGIPEDKQKAVFDRFIQLKQSPGDNTGGTGLGLSITRGLVSLLGGDITLKSVPGEGSTFSFTIPFRYENL